MKRLGAALLSGLLLEIAGRVALCCGPKPTRAEDERVVAELSVAGGAFLRDSLKGVASRSGSAAACAFELSLARTGHKIAEGAASTIPMVARFVMVSIGSSCGKGVCGTCRMRLVSDVVEMVHAGLIRQGKIDQGWIRDSCSRPTSDASVDG